MLYQTIVLVFYLTNRHRNMHGRGVNTKIFLETNILGKRFSVYRPTSYWHNYSHINHYKQPKLYFYFIF